MAESVEKIKSSRNKRRHTCWGRVTLDNCVTALSENLTVNWAPPPPQVPSSSKGSSKRGSSSSYNNNNNDDGDGAGDAGTSNGADSRVLMGVVHLDTFLIHEVNIDTRRPFSSKPIHTIQLPSSTQLQKRCVILRVKWVALKNGAVKVLLLCTNIASYFYNEMGTKQLFKWDYGATTPSSSTGEEKSDMGKCARAISATNDFILLGNDRGDVHLFTCENSRTAKGGMIIQLAKTLKLCDSVAELCGKRSGLVMVGTPTGNLAVWTGFQGEANQPVKQTEYVLSKPEPVTGLQLWYPYAIVAYGSGIIRLYNLVQKALSAQVYAHGRWISAMDLCPGQNLLLTVAEDDEARIWTLRKRQKGEMRSPIKFHSGIHIKDVNLIGGRFLNGLGSLIALTELGSKEVVVFASAEETSL